LDSNTYQILRHSTDYINLEVKAQRIRISNKRRA
jgi:hypothetical protein